MSNLPAAPNGSNDGREDGGGNQILNIGNYHCHGNDLKEIARIAETNPDLADKLIDNSDRHHQRSNFSYRFGIVATLILVVMVLATFLTLFILKGILATICNRCMLQRGCFADTCDSDGTVVRRYSCRWCNQKACEVVRFV